MPMHPGEKKKTKTKQSEQQNPTTTTQQPRPRSPTTSPSPTPPPPPKPLPSCLFPLHSPLPFPTFPISPLPTPHSPPSNSKLYLKQTHAKQFTNHRDEDEDAGLTIDSKRFQALHGTEQDVHNQVRRWEENSRGVRGKGRKEGRMSMYV